MASPLQHRGRIEQRLALALGRLDQVELRFCLALNRAVARAGLRRSFQLASRLGDGLAWYLLIGLLPLFYGRAALWLSLQMALAGLAGLLLYRELKRRLVRERPFITHQVITRAAVPLDRFSFPSGHTLHAVCFTLLASIEHPLLAFVLAPLTAMIAVSRVVLGLHYPSDVLAGALLGSGIAGAARLLPMP